MARLQDRLKAWASKPMRPGEGLHVDIFRAAILMLEERIPEDVVFEFLRQAANRVTDRHVPDREIHGAIQSAKDRLAGGKIETSRWPAYSEQLRSEIVSRSNVSVADLGAMSEALSQDPWFYLCQLYRDDEFVCLGEMASVFFTKRRKDLFHSVQTSKFEYVNPSPMTEEFGFTKDGVVSAHTLDNCGPKTYQVVEFDHGQISDHAAIHWWLAGFAPLIMLVYSGGKSLHGWYNVRNMNEVDVLSFFSRAVQVGADPKMWSRCQFSRLPAGLNRKTGKAQTVVLFEPKHLK